MNTDSAPNEADDYVPERAIDFNAQAPDNDTWRARAKAYDSQYKGPVHWVRFINVLAASGSVPLAMRETGISRVAFNRRRERYPEFTVEADDAMAHFREAVIEKAALTRAVDGWLEPVFYKGEAIGHVRKYSDTLLNKLLEGNMPEKYRSKTENSAPGSITITGGLPPDEEEAPATPSAEPAAPVPSTDSHPLD